ncbi:hypothetical protein JCM19992_02380 [Thermostilla marina]
MQRCACNRKPVWSTPVRLALIWGIWACWGTAVPVAAQPADDELPDAKPVPDVQVVPLPYDQASFQYRGVELVRFHFGASLKRPFLFPVRGSAGRSLTRMGHPHDPVSHSHHNSVWMSHQNVEGVNFWEDPGPQRIACQKIVRFDDGDRRAAVTAEIRWLDPEEKPLVDEVRTISLWVDPETPIAEATGIPRAYLVTIESRFQPAGKPSVMFETTPFGLIGVRMAKTIGVNDGGGRILNSEGARNEKAVFRKPARWVDYSGCITASKTAGIALFDHPANPGFPSPFHVRNDGWMGICLTLDGPREATSTEPLTVVYGLWVHDGVPKRTAIDQAWRDFVDRIAR